MQVFRANQTKWVSAGWLEISAFLLSIQPSAFDILYLTAKSVARAAEEAAISAAQEAKRAAAAAQELMAKAKEAADKAERAMEIAGANEKL